MKRMQMILRALVIGLAATPAFAVDTAKVYKSGPLVLIFLGFFALLIVIQVLPALATLASMVKGLFSQKGARDEMVPEKSPKQ